MKTEEPPQADMEGKAGDKDDEGDRPPGGGAVGGTESGGPSRGATNGTARATDAAQASEPPRSASDLPPVQRSRVLRSVYWLLWFGLVPITLACVVVWALTPPSGAEFTGALGFAQSLVHGQPVPVGIVLFTVFAIALWAARHDLPFAKHAHPPIRSDLSPRLRVQFERARVLLDESEAIFTKHERAIVRDLTAKERDRLRASLDALRDAMDRVPLDEDGFLEALAHADGEVDVRLGRWRKSEVREYLEAILMAVAVAFALRAFVIEAFKIPSGSMIPTLIVGDHIFVNKFSYGPAIPYTHARVWTSMPPKRGDVIVFAFPEHPEQDFIKRVIAIEGDTLEAHNGHPIVNGWPVPSCFVGPWSYSDFDTPQRHEGDLYVEYLGDESFLTFYDKASMGFSEQGPFYAKKGEVWVMGDNRNNSHDSRMWFNGQGGGVPFENIRGRALFVWLSVSDSFDWSREGAPVMGRPRLPPTARGLNARFEKCLADRPSVTLPPAGHP
ncbi:MAG TPA: signal peptidase I [Polyangiaceae bacterium]|nr:signal peptidase I [Polyangiaceae bacterium]